MAEPSDRDWLVLLPEDVERGWRRFVDRYTPTLLSLIARSGVRDPDDVSDLYVRVCERLAENDCARLKQYDPGGGDVAAWLTVVVRNAVVDWVRSRTGRRRMFGTLRSLRALDRRVFELYYWEHRRASEIVEILRTEGEDSLSLTDVLSALQRIDDALSDRHRGELLAFVARVSRAASLDTDDLPPARADGPRDDPEHALRVKERDALLASALAALSVEEAAILRLRFVQGFSREEVRRALHLDRLAPGRIAEILERLRASLSDEPRLRERGSR